MTQSWKNRNWKLWLLSLLVVGVVIATSGYRTLAENSITEQLLTTSDFTVQAASSLIDIRTQRQIPQHYYQLNLATLISKSTANNPSSDRIYLQVQGKMVSPASSMNPGVKVGDQVQLSSTIRFDYTVNLELDRITNNGDVESIDNPKNLNAKSKNVICNSSGQQLEFIDKKTSAHYTLNYSCSEVDI